MPMLALHILKLKGNVSNIPRSYDIQEISTKHDDSQHKTVHNDTQH
jgi:hypothetical protein